MYNTMCFIVVFYVLQCSHNASLLVMKYLIYHYMKTFSFASAGINYILSNIEIDNSYFKLYNIFKTEKEKPDPDNFALCETMQLRCLWSACVVLGDEL